MTEPERDEADAIEQRTPVDPTMDDPDAVLPDDEERPPAATDVTRFA